MLHWQNTIFGLKWWSELLIALVRLRSERRALTRRYIMNFFANRENIRELIYFREDYCFHLIRMNRRSFVTLCDMLRNDGGLKDTKKMLVDEQVAVVLHIFAHHCKNRIAKIMWKRSAESVSRAVKNVTNAIIRLQDQLLKKQEPIPEILPNDQRWEKWKPFKKCLGALDGTYIRVRVATEDKARYRSRKSEIATNVLAVCSPNMEFIYILSGWEGSAADSRVLKDAISRNHGLKVPRGYYYLVDAGYTNCEGFLAPFRGQRYHLNEWRNGYQPQNSREFFNMKHSRARNVIERCFGLLKIRWAILRDPSWYPVDVHNRIILACCLLHNFIRREMPNDPLEARLTAEEAENLNCDDNVAVIETSEEWSGWRENLAHHMFNQWNAN